MNIKRYDNQHCAFPQTLREFPDGDYVLYTDHIAALEAVKATVKPLAWRFWDLKHDYGKGTYEANTPFETYVIMDVAERYPDDNRYYCRKLSNQFETLDEAKAACQADYADRILSAIAPSPALEAVKATVEVSGSSFVACLVALAEAGIPPDVQELLVRGDPMRGIKPNALHNAVATAIAPSPALEANQQVIETLRAALEGVIDDLELRSKNGVVDLSHGVYCTARAALSDNPKGNAS